ncbi:hypothetical protein CMK14_25685 [Candidatus Poribacteria bacterium]|nr:hypothetical protein [Candidatus Poribacteria bacterium]
MVCETQKNDDQPTWWDQATIIGHFSRPRQIEILVNQVGYDLEAPKCFTIQTNFLPTDDNAVSGQLVDLIRYSSLPCGLEPSRLDKRRI